MLFVKSRVGPLGYMALPHKQILLSEIGRLVGAYANSGWANEVVRSTAAAWRSTARIWGSGDSLTVRVTSTIAYLVQPHARFQCQVRVYTVCIYTYS
ncbi:hypothetical protein FOFC_18368 [Fusarium oxysporum]|nr:hypothetical protein FOFC_18368 [Fusarium oxysporum]